MLPRIYQNLDTWLDPNIVLVIYGPRRVGKTTLVNNYLEQTKYKYRFDTGEDIRIQEVLSSQDLGKIKDYVGDNQLIVLDEAQNIPNVGMGLKLMVDHVPEIRVIATGSASFDLSNKVGEPLVGRKWTKILYPISQIELLDYHGRFDLTQKLSKQLVFGSYPEMETATSDEVRKNILDEIANGYLLKDILAIVQVKSAHIILKLLQLLAFQIGSEVSLTELGTQLEIDKKTVQRYLYLLEQTFVIITLRPFHRNMRKALSKKNKYYFVDNGIRNSLINNFNSVENRDDLGKLWENFLVVERIKKQAYHGIHANNYFWRTYDQKEIDWVEERDGKLFGFEFKWKNAQSKHQKSWLASYPDEAEYQLINRENHLDFVS